MFDAVTVELIRRAPALPGLDRDRLVDQLTSAHIEIAVARLAVKGEVRNNSEELEKILARLARLADTYEGHVILGLNSDRVKSSAFVAASARRILAQVEGSALRAARLDKDAVGPEITSAILFLIAERSVDAAEASQAIISDGESNPVRRRLIGNLRSLARGEFLSIVSNPLPGDLADLDDESRAVDLLLKRIDEGLVLLAKGGLAGGETTERAQEVFTQVRGLSLDVSEVISDDWSGPVVSMFAGPHHLAALLEQAAGSFNHRVIINTPAPTGANPAAWGEWLRKEAEKRPYLWTSHRKAIETGYLDCGSSMVMTTPTGSGKTTLSMLKIVSTLTSGKTVIYLAPTHALISQIETDLKQRVEDLGEVESVEDVAEDIRSLPLLAIMTPEKCLALLAFAPELFSNVGLLIFDEFHLLGASRTMQSHGSLKADRRQIDAMLCLLTFMKVSPDADYLLLSAMISNGKEVSEWLEHVLKRPVYSYSNRWKPTRQLRSCVFYEIQDMIHLERRLAENGKKAKDLEAMPYGLFSLASVWNPTAPDRLAIRPLCALPVSLGKDAKGRHLTSNRYQVAAAIARPLARSGLKVVVFCESVPMSVSLAAGINSAEIVPSIPLRHELTEWRNAAINEIGRPDAIYDVRNKVAAVHHGELLASERKLVETLFRDRGSGLNVLAATTTLAQGLNLPCDVVILAGTDRLDDEDPEEKRRAPLLPQEIANALGRAGRAGHSSTGFSVVIPGSPIRGDINRKAVPIRREFETIFSGIDQCVDLADPLEALLDQIEVDSAPSSGAMYLFRRLAPTLTSGPQEADAFDQLVQKSFGFCRKFRINPSRAEDWKFLRREALLRRTQLGLSSVAVPWQQELAGRVGTSVELIVRLTRSWELAPKHCQSSAEWMIWLIQQLDIESEDFDLFIRPESLGRVFGRAYVNRPDERDRKLLAIDGIKLALGPWLSGEPLTNLEKVISNFISSNEGEVKRPTGADPRVKRARRFAMRVAPDLGFLCGAFLQVASQQCKEKNQVLEPTLGCLSNLVRLGFDTIYHLAFSRMRPELSRPEVHSELDLIWRDIERNAADDWKTSWRKVSAAALGPMDMTSSWSQTQEEEDETSAMEMDYQF